MDNKAPEIEAHVYVAYVDGSVDQETGQASWGLAIYQNNKLVKEDCGMVDYSKLPTDAGQSRQVAGELTAAMKAILWAKRSDTKVAIVYDFIGIRNWVVGDWKAKKELTRYYRDFMLKNIKCVDSWHWVKSHTNILGNENADRLAKKAMDK